MYHVTYVSIKDSKFGPTVCIGRPSVWPDRYIPMGSGQKPNKTVRSFRQHPELSFRASGHSVWSFRSQPLLLLLVWVRSGTPHSPDRYKPNEMSSSERIFNPWYQCIFHLDSLLFGFFFHMVTTYFVASGLVSQSVSTYPLIWSIDIFNKSTLFNSRNLYSMVLNHIMIIPYDNMLIN